MSFDIDWMMNIRLEDIEADVFRDVIKVADVQLQPMGDGQILLISDIKRVTLILETSNGEKRTIKAIGKVECPPGAGNELATKFNAFTTESLMYSDILKRMTEMLSKIDDKDTPWPDCYYAANNKFLFEDLCESGYRIVPTYKFLDFEHTLLVMKAIGKFHGLSMILIENGHIDNTKFKEPYVVSKDPMIDKMNVTLIKKMIQFIKDNWEPEWTPIADRLDKYLANPSEHLYSLWLSTKDTWNVLNHGDFSMRNMLFHYQPDSSHPDGIKFIDFQLCNYSNLGFDLVMLLYGSLLPSTRDDNMTQFLTAYTDSLTTVCRQHGYKGALPSFEDVKSCLKSLDFFANFMSLFQLPFFLMTDKDDSQEKATEFIEDMLGQKEPSDFIDFSHKEVQALLKSEINRCIRENLF